MNNSTKENESLESAGDNPLIGSWHSTAMRSKGAQPGRQLLVTFSIFIGLGVGIYFLAVYARVQNSREFAALAVAAGQKTVAVVKPTQSDATAPLILPGNIEANRSTSIYARVDGYLKKWYVDIGDHVKEGQVLADIEAPQIDADLREAQAPLE